jgi:predicted transcriptional regulator
VYRRKSASVQDVLDEIPEPPSYSSIRALLSILEQKGFLKHRQNGKKYIYTPTIPRKRAIQASIKHLLQMYFNNSIEEAVGALIEVNHKSLTDEGLDKLLVLIANARKEEQG